MAERTLETKIVKDVKVVLRACGDYVAFHEMSLYTEYVFGTTQNTDIFENIIDCDEVSEEVKTLISKIWDGNVEITKEQQKELDSLVENFIKNYDGEYCDYEIFSGVEINNKIYVSI